MLINFSVSNFLSFKDAQSLSMISNKSNRLKNHLILNNDKRVLKSALLFGANASGKSNFIKAIDFAKKIVVKGDLSRVNLDKKYFRIDTNQKTKPGIFQFDIEIDNRSYNYGFAISYSDQKLLGEWLYDTTTAKEDVIFSREFDKKTNVFTVESDFKIADSKDKDRFQIYLKDFEKDEMSNLLMLTDLSKRISDIKECSILKQIFIWFLRIVVVYPSTHAKAWCFQAIQAKDVDLNNFLSGLDTGIKNLTINEVDFDSVIEKIPNDIRDEIKNNVINDLKQNHKKNGILTINNNVYLVKNKTNTNKIEPVIQTISFNHGNASDFFEFEDESEGTRRVFDLLPLLLMTNNDCLILIDELDQSLHTKLAQQFYKIFMNSSNTSKSQLIFTTHDILLMDLDLERQDEIWFVEREPDQFSKINSLSDYKVRCDKKSISSDYLLGRYGALPILSNISELGIANEQ